MGVQHLKEVAPRASLACAGFALFAPCYSVSTLHGHEGFSPSLGMPFSSVVILAEFVTLMAVACLSARISCLRNRTGVIYAVAALLAASTLVPGLLGQNTHGAAMLLLGAVGGCAKSIGALAWLELFCTFEMRTVCIAFPAGLIAGQLVIGGIDLLPQPVATIVGTAGCVASLILLVLMSRREVELPAVPEPMGRDAWTFPWRPTVLMGIYSLASLCITTCSPSPPSHALVRTLVVQGVYLMLIVATVAGYMRFDIKVFQQVAAPLVIGGAVISLPALAAALPEGIPLSRLGFTAFSLYTYIVFFNMSYRFGVNPLWLFGFSRAVRVAPSLVMGLIDPGIVAGHEYAVLGVVIVLVSIGSSLFVTGETFDSTWGVRQVGACAPRGTTPSLSEQCHRAAYLYGLTKREEEVLVLLAQNRSTPEIETALCISNGTARNHIQHVYKKLDVHSRADVADFLTRKLVG